MRRKPDPFARHPELRGLIAPPEASFFRRFYPADLERQLAAQGVAPGWRIPDAAREASRRAFLDRHLDGDLWVFAYGSLMWDPGLRFAEVRRARLDGFHRKFCLVDTLGGRGTVALPGLMAGLDRGGACDGLAFRIAAAEVETETEILWRREMMAPAYLPTAARVTLDDASATMLAFVADPSADMVRTDLDRDTQIRILATGTGFLGSSLDYIDALLAGLEALRIADPELVALRDAARSRAMPGTAGPPARAADSPRPAPPG